jgi:predicted NBD/HSP70 family sugar kinase
MAKAILAKPGGSPEPTLPTHGASTLPSVEVDCYSLELEDEEGYAGDKANRRAFVQILDDVRQALRKAGDEDPLGDKRSEEISKKKLEQLLTEGDPEAGAIVQSAVEDFAQQLASVIRRFLRLKAWRDTECIVVGGGFRAGRIGELVIARTAIILKSDGIGLDLQLIHDHPDEAGLIGAAHLLPAWMVEGHDAMLAVDVGGTNIRAGVVKLNLAKAKDLSKARVAEMKLWRHGDEEELRRDEAIDGLVEMIQELIVYAKENRLRLAPVIGIGCPGTIRADGSIERGAQNLPGNWESPKFNLPAILREKIPDIGEHEALVVMHNDAVVQGLSEIPYMKDRVHWGVLTIGTGLGNARFTNRQKRK